MKPNYYFVCKYRQLTFAKKTFGKSEIEKREEIFWGFSKIKVGYSKNLGLLEDYLLKVIYYKNELIVRGPLEFRFYEREVSHHYISELILDADINLKLMLNMRKLLVHNYYYDNFWPKLLKITQDENLLKFIKKEGYI